MKLKPADVAFSKCIRQRDNWTCRKCGKYYGPENARGLDCSHHMGRTRRSTRWAAENAVALCMGCHRWFHSFPIESAAWVEKMMGKKNYELLLEKANSIGPKVTKKEEKEIAKHYRSEFKRMVEEDSNDFVSYQ